MDLGAFSVSLAVKDIHASRQFYSALGFNEIAGDIAQNWLIMKNGQHVIGLFQGMFNNNILTFNPRWHQDCTENPDAPDIRDIQAALKAAGIALDAEVDPNSQGPASLTLTDPDGNTLLLDQHC